MQWLEIVKYFSYDIKIDGTVSLQDKSDNYYELDKWYCPKAQYSNPSILFDTLIFCLK